MYYLTICILLNVFLFVAFRTFTSWRIKVFPAVVVNYTICAILGVFFLQGISWHEITPFAETWHYYALLLGGIFIATFFMLGMTTNVFGITIATISSKMSLIIPVTFGLFVFKTTVHTFNFWNYLGIALALAAVVLTSIRDSNTAFSWSSRGLKQFLPLALFLLAGTLDTIINYVNYKFLNVETQIVFIWLIFLTAASIGIFILVIRWEPFPWKSLWGGIYLGIPNFFSMYFIVKALSAFNNDGAVLFPLFNVGIIIGSTLAAVTIFREQLLTINRLGIILAILSVLMISYQEIVVWLN